MLSKTMSLQFLMGVALGSAIACSPTKFAQVKDANKLCDSSVSVCSIQTQSVDIVQKFKIGSGKVDILFVNDNSASMSKTQIALAEKFFGFINSLDSKNIDYRIAITTTDIKSVQKRPLVQFDSGKYFITNTDSDRISIFNNAIIRNETLACEDLIVSMFNTYGTSFQSNTEYTRLYPISCPSSDTRGIYSANLVVSQNAASFLRSDANLNIILISNDNVRQGYKLEENDTGAAFSDLMRQLYPNKYWDFNSIIVKDESCRQMQNLKNMSGTVIKNSYGPAISGGLGIEYANLSNSVARDIDNNPRPRGQVLSLCENNFANHFNSMSTQISDESRMFSMKCSPAVSPVVTAADSNLNIPFTWSGDKIIFSRGHEGTEVSINYKCYTGPT